MQNGFVESFNSRMRDELLNETLFFDIDDALTKIVARITDYNDERPHSALGYLTRRPRPPPSPQRALGSATRPASPIARCSTYADPRKNCRSSNCRLVTVQRQVTAR
jgi:hypothetical protein